MAFGLAAYASSPGLPHSTQDSLPAVGQTLLDGLLPAGLQRKVSECSLHLVLLSRALPGAITSTEAPAGSWGTAKRGHSCRTAMLLSPSARERLPAPEFDQAPQREKQPAHWRRSRSPGPARGRRLLGHPRGGSPARPTPPVPLAGDSAGRVPVSLACQLRAIAPCVHRGGTCSNRPTRGASETVVLTPGGVLTRDSESFGGRLSGSE
jgi:hypothetical protein